MGLPVTEGTAMVEDKEATHHVGFYPGIIIKALQSRADAEGDAAIAQVAQRDLERYYGTIACSAPWLERNEWLLIFDAMHNAVAEKRTVPFLWASLRVVREDYALKWGVDRRVLLAKFRKLTYIEALSVVDATERFWADPRGSLEHPDDALRNLNVIAPPHAVNDGKILSIRA